MNDKDLEQMIQDQQAIMEMLDVHLNRRKTYKNGVLNDYGVSFMKPMGQSIVNDNHKDVDGGPLLQAEQT